MEKKKVCVRKTFIAGELRRKENLLKKEERKFLRKVRKYWEWKLLHVAENILNKDLKSLTVRDWIVLANTLNGEHKKVLSEITDKLDKVRDSIIDFYTEQRKKFRRE